MNFKKIIFIIILIFSFFLTNNSYSKWHDTESVNLNGHTGSVNIATSAISISLDSEDLYPGFVGEVSFNVTNIGRSPCKITYVFINKPEWIIVNVDYPENMISGQTSEITLSISIPEDLETNMDEEINFDIELTASQN